MANILRHWLYIIYVACCIVSEKGIGSVTLRQFCPASYKYHIKTKKNKQNSIIPSGSALKNYPDVITDCL